MKQKFEKWNRWLETILSEVQNLVLYQSIYQELQAIINKNKDIQKPSVFYRFHVQFLCCLGSDDHKASCKITGR
jgi:hypothetical protein